MRSRFAAVALLALLPGLGLVAAAPAQAADRPADEVTPQFASAIVNWGSGLCLGIHGSSQSGGARAVQGRCSGDTSQTWGWRATTKIGSGSNAHTYVQLRNSHSGLCLGVQGSSASSGAQLVQGSCGGTSDHSQFWWPDEGGGSTPQLLVNGHSGLCMGIQGSSKAGGANVLQGTCSGSATQHWYFG